MSGLFQDDPPASDTLPDAPPPDGPGLFGDALPVVAKTETAAYRVLARKYRPTTFGDLIGQDVMVRTLRNAFALDRVAHAFMLTGVRGVGKTTTARLIARAMNCIGPDGNGGPTIDPCGVCANCVAILADRHPDVQEMDAASRTGVDDVREIIEATRFRPMQARTKVFIIDEVHMLTRNAFNALLKTLEEPPPTVKFIFATTEIRKVPVTVLSRCQRFDLRRISAVELAGLFGRVAAAEKVEVAEEALMLIARAADGSARDGLSLLDQAIAQAEPGGRVEAEGVADMLGLGYRDTIFDALDAAMAGRTAELLALTDAAHSRGTDLGVLLQDLLELVHTLTRLKAVPELRQGRELPEAERTRGAEMADKLSMATLARCWQMLLKGIGEVEAAPDRRAAAEMVLIRLCYVADLPTPGDLVRKLTTEGPAPALAAPSPAPPPRGGGAMRAMGGGGAAAMPVPVSEPEPPPPAPRVTSFREAVAIAHAREPMLHAHLRHSVHLVRFAPPVIELRQQPEAPRDLAARFAALLLDATGIRWTIALSAASGEPTLDSQGAAANDARRDEAAQHPLVLAILEAFPGAKIAQVTDRNADVFGLAMDEPPSMLEPEGPEFAPIDAEFVEDMTET